jgi:5-methylcytosine-specific restriction endonuclease McrA
MADPIGMRSKLRSWMRTANGRARMSVYNARRRGAYDCPATEAFARDVLSADPCSYCGASGGTVDHIDAFSRTEDGSLENLTGACIDCNRRKNALPLLGFLLRRVEVV